MFDTAFVPDDAAPARQPGGAGRAPLG